MTGSSVLPSRELPRWAAIPIVLFLGFIAFVFWSDWRDETRLREWLLGQLNGLSTDVRIQVNGQRVPNAASFVDVLKRVAHVGAHHSHPLEPIRVEIADGSKVLSLVLARDSQVPTEYWVLVPDAVHQERSLGREAGRLTATASEIP
jgi:hypothetical protein